MAIRHLRLEEDPILRKISRPVTRFDERLAELAGDMVDTMRSELGIGLAAPQVGILRRLIVVCVSEESEPLVLVNPSIAEQEGEQIEVEGCLSLPGMSGRVRRPMRVRVEYQDLHGEKRTTEGEGLLARAFCHEIDHLDGILYTDKLIGEPLCNECGQPYSECECDEDHDEHCECGCGHEH